MTKARCLTVFAGSDGLRSRKLPLTSKVTSNPRELGDPLSILPGVGPALAAAARKLGLETLGDLLFHFPLRHEDFTVQKQIGELRWGEEATVRCKVEKISLQRTRRRNLRLVKAMVGDETGYMEAVWYNQDYLADQLTPGDELLLRGVYEGAGGTVYTVNSHELLRSSDEGMHTSGFVPVYLTLDTIPVKSFCVFLFLFWLPSA